MLKNTAKRVPVAAVFTITLDKADTGANILGFIEGDIAITRVMLIVTEAFNGTTPTLTVTDHQGGPAETHFTTEALGAETVVTSLAFTPTTGTIKPLYRAGNGQWDCELVAGGSTEGEAMVVVEYIQLDTEPGLHSSEDS